MLGKQCPEGTTNCPS